MGASVDSRPARNLRDAPRRFFSCGEEAWCWQYRIAMKLKTKLYVLEYRAHMTQIATIAMAAGLFVLTIAMGVGIFGATMGIWLPHIGEYRT